MWKTEIEFLTWIRNCPVFEVIKTHESNAGGAYLV